jgi:Protein of unknown function (DUF2934)
MFILQKGIVMATAKASPKKKPAPKIVDKKTTDKKTAAKKAPSTKATALKIVTPKKTTTKKTAAKKMESMSGFERYKMIEVAAYYIAEKNGFAGYSIDYWAAAEKEIDKKLAKK